jgi:hypothetical protein
MKPIENAVRTVEVDMDMARMVRTDNSKMDKSQQWTH